MSIFSIIDNLVLGDRVNLDTVPYLKKLLKAIGCDAYVKQLVLEIIQGLLVVLRDHNCSRIDVAAEQLCHFFVTNSEEIRTNSTKAIALVKYLVTFPMSVYAQGEQNDCVQFCHEVKPPNGCSPFRPTGQFRNWFWRRLLKCNVRKSNTHLWWSWFQVKRNTPTVSEEFVIECYAKHRATLTKQDPCPLGLIETPFFGIKWVDPLHLIEDEIESIAKELQPGTLQPLVRTTPKRSASYGYSQKSGGSLAAVREFLGGKLPFLWQHSLTLERIEHYVYVDGFVRLFNFHVSHYVLADVFDQLPFVDQLRVETLLGQENDGWSMPCAQVYGICEPLKVRIITKGPAPLYWRAKPLQRAIWGAMKEMSVFRLIGRPIAADDLVDTCKEAYMASVDYSAATDGVSQGLGKRILWAILTHKESRLSLWAIDAGMTAFGSHRLEYPVDEVDDAVQSNGQLMGSIMSFVVLCLLNLLTARLASLVTGFEPVDLLINGDDMCYSCPSPRYWEVQCRIAKLIGLEPSVGKCYLSKHCVSMNSVMFHRDRSGHLTRQDYLPVGLIHGKHKVSNADTTVDEGDDEETTGLASCLKLIIEGARHPDVATMRFLAYNSGTLARECRGRNLFLPIWLGGFGLSPPAGLKVTYTKEQRSQARRLYLELKGTNRVAFTPNIGPWKNTHYLPGEPPEERVVHWSGAQLEENIERKGLRCGLLQPTSRQPVWLRKLGRLRPVLDAAASGYSRQSAQKGDEASLNSSVPRIDDEIEAWITASRVWYQDIVEPESRETARVRHAILELPQEQQEGRAVDCDVQSRGSPPGLTHYEHIENDCRYDDVQGGSQTCEARSAYSAEQTSDDGHNNEGGRECFAACTDAEPALVRHGCSPVEWSSTAP